MKQDVSFYSEGALIKGHLYLPEDGEGKKPAVVLCHGFAGIKELLLPAYAEAFCKNGYAALTFDYRGFGESEGERGKLQPQLQITDIRNALTFMQSLNEVDPQRLGLWGTSFGGANAVTTTALDKRVKCLTVQLTFADGERVVAGNMSAEEKEKMTTTIDKMWERAVTKNKIMTVPIHKVLTDDQSIEFYNNYKDKFPAFDIKIPFLTVKESMEHKPEKYLPDVNVPIFIVAATDDKVNPKEESEILFQKANEPKELLMMENATHYELYEGEKFEIVVARQIEWFNKYL